MRNIIAIAAASLIVAGTVPALASGDDESCRGEHHQTSLPQTAAAFTGMGHDAYEGDGDDGCIAAKGSDHESARLEREPDSFTGHDEHHDQ